MRLIDADALAEEMATLAVTVTGLRAGKGVLNEYMHQYRESVLRVIDEQPTVEAEPVTYGEWIERPVNTGTPTKDFFCSRCNWAAWNWKTKRCPSCGAKMK